MANGATNNDCCKLVGNLSIGDLDGCITSVNVSSRGEILAKCGETLLLGPSTGTVSITGYAVEVTANDSGLHTGCPGRAGVNIPWVRRYDCDNNITYLISAGEGTSYVAGDVQDLATLNIATGRAYPTINANSSSGPATVYMETSQEEGYGLTYDGGPISFNTENDMTIANFGVGDGTLYLQNISVEFNPGEIPTASYSFMFIVSEVSEGGT